MAENNNEKRQSVYEISYLLVSGLAEEKVPAETEALRKIIESAGASMVAEEAPHRERLAYTMRRKTVSGSYEKYDEAYFGWFKFEIANEKIDEVKKAFEKQPAVLRVLLVSTVRENTYLGKRAPAIAASFSAKPEPAEVKEEEKVEVKKEAPAAPASIEEMDKSIDEMVKEA